MGYGARQKLRSRPRRQRITSRDCRFDINLASQEEMVIEVVVTFELQGNSNGTIPYDRALASSIEETRIAGGDL
jgi:hypothetical protein